jgi:hypothetical protein
MKRTTAIVALLVAYLASPSIAMAEDEATISLKCEVGPVAKSYGGTNWLLYACDDGRSLVVVSGEGNPATPFYFMFAWQDGTYLLRGEGTGDKKATQAAFDDLSKLDSSEVERLVQEIRNRRATQ